MTSTGSFGVMRGFFAIQKKRVGINPHYLVAVCLNDHSAGCARNLNRPLPRSA